MKIDLDGLNDDGIFALMRDHLADMYATSPPDSVHALKPGELRSPDITFWSARENGEVLGCIALREIDRRNGEIKSMRTTPASRGQGLGGRLLTTLIDEAARRGYERLWLETGPQAFFAPAVRLYARFGFETCGPFADYAPDKHSLFMTRAVNR